MSEQIHLSQRKKEGYLRLAKIIQWGRKQPVHFMERFMKVELMDYQKYVFMNSWHTPYCLWCMSRNGGKSVLGALFIMAKTMLIPNYSVYILAGTGAQSQELFLKIEKIAKREIASFTGLTDVFYNETVKNVADSDGFTHNPASFKFSLYNGSNVNSLNGAYDNIRGKRSNLNFYDEAGFAPDELFEATEPFTTQNSDFRLGGDSDATILPRQIPNQLIYASSASSIDTYFYQKYKDFSKKMYLGDKRYFVADINSDAIINATLDGKKLYTPLLNQETVDTAIRSNKEKGMREYKNIFTKEGSDQQIIKRSTIVRNSEVRPPTLANNGTQKFIMAVDPARSHDNSICTIAEVVEDENRGYMLNISNIINFVDEDKKRKTPMKTPDQIKKFKNLILDYNGAQKADYENIEAILIDSGSGGSGVSAWGDSLLEDWVDDKGVSHRGLIDKEFGEYKSYASKYPNAIEGKLKLISPHKYKKDLFDALIEMMKLDLIKFPESYDNKGVLTLQKISKNKKGKEEAETETYELSDDEILALINIDLAKEELVSIYEFKSSNGSVRYDLAPDKVNKMHDDRAYTIAMLAWHLRNMRRRNITRKEAPKIDPSKLFLMKQPSRFK